MNGLLAHPIIRLFVSIGACIVAGCISAFFIFFQSSAWFSTLEQPSFLPQNLLLILIVMFVYLLLGFTLYLLWQSSKVYEVDKKLCIALLFFTIILLNAWVYMFFGLESPIMGILMGALAVATLIATMVQSVRVSFGATLILFMLVILIFIAAYANYVILEINPSLQVFGT